MQGIIRSVLGVLATTALLASASPVGAAEISVVSGGAVKSALDLVSAKFEQATGHRVSIVYLPMGSLMQKLAEGQRPDIAVLTNDVMAEAQAKRWVEAGTEVALGGVGVGVAVRDGAATPDISTPEALKQTLLAAKSITYMDPHKGTSGRHFAEVLQRLGIADAVRDKTHLADGGYVVESVARGEVELGIQQITEILPVAHVRLVGPLPEPLQKITVYAATLGPAPQNWQAAQDFLAYLRGPDSRAMFMSKGFLAR